MLADLILVNICQMRPLNLTPIFFSLKTVYSMYIQNWGKTVNVKMLADLILVNICQMRPLNLTPIPFPLKTVYSMYIQHVVNMKYQNKIESFLFL